jgi:hypothetical protein
MGKTARRIVMLLVACALAAPVAARAAYTGPATGGASMPDIDPALVATAHVLKGRVARFHGTMPLRNAGRTVLIERLDARDGSWVGIAGATIAADGSYSTRWRADVVGQMRARARLAGAVASNVSGGAEVASSSPTEAAVTVYRPGMASWYGPGFYGRRTACGQRLTRTLLGVAHRTLPCGTEVALAYHGRTITVPVVDRGPFRHGRRWDLTSETAQALGFEATDRIGAVRVGD